METKELLAKIKKAVLAIEPDAEIILFGSEARGTASKHSDIDLLILINRELTYKEKDQLYEPLYRLELETGKIISPFILSKGEWKDQSRKSLFYYEVEREGILL